MVLGWVLCATIRRPMLRRVCGHLQRTEYLRSTSSSRLRHETGCRADQIQVLLTCQFKASFGCSALPSIRPGVSTDGRHMGRRTTRPRLSQAGSLRVLDLRVLPSSSPLDRESVGVSVARSGIGGLLQSVFFLGLGGPEEADEKASKATKSQKTLKWMCPLFVVKFMVPG